MIMKKHLLFISLLGTSISCFSMDDKNRKDEKVGEVEKEDQLVQFVAQAGWPTRSTSPISPLKAAIERASSQERAPQDLQQFFDRAKQQTDSSRGFLIRLTPDLIESIVECLVKNTKDLPDVIEAVSNLISTSKAFIDPIINVLYRMFRDKGFSKRTIAIALSRTAGGLSWLTQNIEENLENLEKPNPYDLTDFSYAAGLDCVNAMRLLKSNGADIESNKNEDQNTPLMVASLNNAAAAAAELIAWQVNLDAKNSKQETALILATKEGNSAVVELLVDAGADKEIADPEEGTALIISINREDRKDCFDALLRSGANPNVTLKNMHSCLTLAIFLKRRSMIVPLVKANADVNYQDNVHKRTPLMWACDKSLEAIVNLLLNRAADVGARDISGYTALDILKLKQDKLSNKMEKAQNRLMLLARVNKLLTPKTTKPSNQENKPSNQEENL